MKTLKKILNRFTRLTTLVFCFLAFINLINVFLLKILLIQDKSFNDYLYITISVIIFLLIISAYDFLLMFIFGNRLDADEK